MAPRWLTEGSERAASAAAIAFGGVQWTTLIDYPGAVAATLFTVGCNFRCPFCHNPELVDPDRLAAGLDRREILEWIGDRAGFLDGVVLSGGEPTIHPGLPAFARSLKDLGLLVKLDTNGARPDVLSELLAADLVDFVAMDVKAPFDRYDALTGVACDVDAIEASIRRIRDGASDYEFRTTVAPTLAREDVLRIVERLRGAKRYWLQPFRVPDKGLVDREWETRDALSVDALDAVWREIRGSFAEGGVRG